MNKTTNNYYKFGAILLILTLYSCIQTVEIKEDSVKIRQKEIILHKTNNTQIINLFGKEYKFIKWLDYSYENYYKKNGISFAYMQDDSLKIIKWVNLYLDKNKVNIENKVIVNSKSTVKDIISVFGNGVLDYDENYTGLVIMYDYFEFIIKLNPEENQELIKNNNVEWYLINPLQFENNKIIGIEIF